MYNTKGCDLSTWDGGIEHDIILDWPQYTWSFTFIKVSEGVWLDPMYYKQWNAARGYTYRGAYNFFKPSVDAKQSALKTIEIMGDDKGELPIVLDLEVTDNLPPATVMANAKSWLSWYEQETGIRPLIYSSLNFLNNIVHSSQYPWLENYSIWLAQYYYDNMQPVSEREKTIQGILDGTISPPPPSIPVPFRRLPFWQWTAQGKPEQVPGYYTGADGKKEVDLNFYMGTEEEMIAEFHLGPLPEHPIEPPLPDTGDEPMKGKVITTSLNIRKTPDTSQTPIGLLKKDDIITASEKVNGGWWHLTSITRNNVGIALPTGPCYAYEGDTQGYIQDITPPITSGKPVSGTVEVMTDDGKIYRGTVTVFTEVT